MKKRMALMLALVLALSLWGCGKAAVTEAEGFEDLEEGAELVYWPMWAKVEYQGKALSQAIAAFTEASGVPVTIHWGASRDTRATLEPALEAGQRVDLFDEELDRLYESWGGWMLDLEPLYEASALPQTMDQKLVELSRELGGGRLGAIPYQPYAFVVMYNRTAFEQAGIRELPQDREQFFELCEALKGAGYHPLTVDDVYLPSFFGYVVDRVAGAEAAEAIARGQLDHPAVLQAAQLIEELVQAGYIDPRAAEQEYPAGQRRLTGKTAAMCLNGTWLPNEVRNEGKVDFEWGAFSLPRLAPEGDGAEAVHYGAHGFAVSKSCPYPKAAFALIEWLTSGAYDQKLADAAYGIPMGTDALCPAQAEDAKKIIASATCRLPWAVGMEEDPRLAQLLRTNLSALLGGRLDARGFADALAGAK